MNDTAAEARPMPPRYGDTWRTNDIEKKVHSDVDWLENEIWTDALKYEEPLSVNDAKHFKLTLTDTAGTIIMPLKYDKWRENDLRSMQSNNCFQTSTV